VIRVAAAAGLIGAALITWVAIRGTLPLVPPSMRRAGVHAPANTRIRVEVLNASAARGLAMSATRQLRDLGYDVVAVGNVPASQRRDTTLVLDRVGRPEWAKLVADALGGAPVESRMDSSRYLEVTVLLGASWRPSPKPLHP
jgi:hypothetical protein